MYPEAFITPLSLLCLAVSYSSGSAAFLMCLWFFIMVAILCSHLPNCVTPNLLLCSWFAGAALKYLPTIVNDVSGIWSQRAQVRKHPGRGASHVPCLASFSSCDAQGSGSYPRRSVPWILLEHALAHYVFMWKESSINSHSSFFRRLILASRINNTNLAFCIL